ncbi:MAG: hypothetical protein HRU19_14150 [Pseudobacteriovorax sp.]|nr:hypothetical protein [Pseudobacteriovorax sp.]
MRLLLILCLMGLHSFPSKAFSVCKNSEFLMGFDQRPINPEGKLTMGGFGTYFLFQSSTRQNGEGIHDDLMVSTAAIYHPSKNSINLLISVDLVGISLATINRIQDEIDQRLPDTENHLIITATHTHHSPDTLGLWGALPFQSGVDDNYMANMETTVAQSAVGAALTTKCLSLSFSAGSKKTNLDDKESNQVLTLWAKSHSGKILGSITQWNAHPTILGSNNNTISSDFPGAFRYYMKQKVPSGIHIYMNGALGDLYVGGPKSSLADPFMDGDKDPDALKDYDIMAFHGRDLADRVSSSLGNQKEIKSSIVAFTQSKFTIPVDNSLFKLAERLNVIDNRGLSNGKTESSVSILNLGGFYIVTLPGEVFPSGTKKIRSILKEKSVQVMFAGIGNDWLGYIMTESEFDQDEYRYHRNLSPHKKTMTVMLDEIENMILEE